jgi:hypothetical protein
VGPDEGLTYRRIYTKHHPSDELQGEACMVLYLHI